jgi:hypothetical protein
MNQRSRFPPGIGEEHGSNMGGNHNPDNNFYGRNPNHKYNQQLQPQYQYAQRNQQPYYQQNQSNQPRHQYRQNQSYQPQSHLQRNQSHQQQSQFHQNQLNQQQQWMRRNSNQIASGSGVEMVKATPQISTIDSR